MKKPLLSGDGFLRDVDRINQQAGALDLWWLGQSGFLLHHRERWILIDPYLSDSLTSKYAQTDKPHVRLTAPVVHPVDLGKTLPHIYLITSSHGHTDHLDPETLKPLLSTTKVAHFVAPSSAIQLAYERSAAGRIEHPPHFDGIDDGVSWGRGVKVTGVAAAHETIERDENGHCKYLGYVFEFSPSFVSPSGSYFESGREWTLFHSGDTVLYDGLVERLRPFNIDVALLPINGRAPERRVAGNLNGREAAHLAKEIGARIVIPCHYDMFEFNTADPQEEFVPECERLGQRYRVLRLGERWSSTELT